MIDHMIDMQERNRLKALETKPVERKWVTQEFRRKTILEIERYMQKRGTGHGAWAYIADDLNAAGLKQFNGNAWNSNTVNNFYKRNRSRVRIHQKAWQKLLNTKPVEQREFFPESEEVEDPIGHVIGEPKVVKTDDGKYRAEVKVKLSDDPKIFGPSAHNFPRNDHATDAMRYATPPLTLEAIERPSTDDDDTDLAFIGIIAFGMWAMAISAAVAFLYLRH